MKYDIQVFYPGQLCYNQIFLWLNDIDPLLTQPISSRVNMNDYAQKMQQNATIIAALVADRIVGAIAIYCNKATDSYITFVGVVCSHQGRGLSKRLMNETIKIARLHESTAILLECDSRLASYYESFGFKTKDTFNSGSATKHHMIYNISSIEHLPFVETPIIQLPAISAELGINLFMKRDDVFPKVQGGNKARKLQYILYKAKQEGCNAVVTAGDINSNHNRATALMCASLGMRCRLIVHNEHPENERYSMNSFMSRISGAELIYCSMKDVASTMDKAMDDFREEGYKPFYIWGGGHCIEGAYAYYEAARNVIETNSTTYDYVFFTSGTGTTHAGLHVGFKMFSPNTIVEGISIARPYERGRDEIYKSMAQLQDFLQEPLSSKDEIIFNDQYVGGKYESIEQDVVDTIKHVALAEGILLDPTYTGKSFNAMTDIIKKNIKKYKGKNILFWNTGGIFNLLTHRNEL